MGDTTRLSGLNERHASACPWWAAVAARFRDGTIRSVLQVVLGPDSGNDSLEGFRGGPSGRRIAFEAPAVAAFAARSAPPAPFEAVLAAATPSGEVVVIDLGGGHSLTLTKTLPGDLDAANFGFPRPPIVGTADRDDVFWTALDDVIEARGGDGFVAPRQGAGRIDAGAGDDVVLPGPGADRAIPGAGADTLRGTPAALDGDGVADFAPEDVIRIDGPALRAHDVALNVGGASRCDCESDTNEAVALGLVALFAAIAHVRILAAGDEMVLWRESPSTAPVKTGGPAMAERAVPQ